MRPARRPAPAAQRRVAPPTPHRRARPPRARARSQAVGPADARATRRPKARRRGWRSWGSLQPASRRSAGAAAPEPECPQRRPPEKKPPVDTPPKKVLKAGMVRDDTLFLYVVEKNGD